VRVIGRADLDEILGEFNGLNSFGDAEPLWTVKAAGTTAGSTPATPATSTPTATSTSTIGSRT
jgi:hypothetical protein